VRHYCCGAGEFLTPKLLRGQYECVLADFFDSAPHPWHGVIFDIKPRFDEVAVVLAEGVSRLPDGVDAFASFPIGCITNQADRWARVRIRAGRHGIDVAKIDGIAVAGQLKYPSIKQIADYGYAAERMGEGNSVPCAVAPGIEVRSQAFAQDSDSALPC